MVKDKILISPSYAKGSNVLIEKILDIFKLNTQVSKETKKNIQCHKCEEGESNQENNVVAIKDIKEILLTDETLNSKKRCIAPIQKTK